MGCGVWVRCGCDATRTPRTEKALTHIRRNNEYIHLCDVDLILYRVRADSAFSSLAMALRIAHLWYWSVHRATCARLSAWLRA